MPLTCTSCGAVFEAPPGGDAAAFAADESARCARLREIAQQRSSLDVARTQAGFAGVTETLDRFAQKASLDRLELSLKAEADKIRKAMKHEPPEGQD